MKAYKLHTPEGARDILFEECALRKDMITDIEKIFKGYGFQQVESPTFEFYDVFSNEWGMNKQEKMYNFFDRQGRILTLRPDLTAPTVRVAATSLKDEVYPLRLFYVGNAYRYTNPQKGNFREFTQAGIELLGNDSAEADAEVIKIAIDSVRACGIDDFQIDIGQAEFFKGIAEEANLDPESIEQILDSIDQKNDVLLEEILNKQSITSNLKELLLSFPRLFGSIDLLNEIKKLTNSKKAHKALERLEQVYDILKMYGVEKYITIDLGMVSSIQYYTGIVFKGYTYGVGYSILSGGRYDGLPKEFGIDTPAVGFGVKLDRLVVARKMQHIPYSYQGVDILIGYAKEMQSEAFEQAASLRSKGKKVELSLLGEDIQINISYAKNKKIPLYIHINAESIQEYNAL